MAAPGRLSTARLRTTFRTALCAPSLLNYRQGRIACCLGVAVCAAGTATAQTPVAAVPIAQCEAADGALLPNLTSAYERGDQEGVMRAASVAIAAARRCAQAPLGANRALLDSIDSRSDYLLLAWPALDRAPEAAIYWTIVHDGAEPHTRRLPGLSRSSRHRLFQIFIAPSRVDRLAGVYVSQRERHALSAQLPAAAAAVSAPLFAAAAAQQGPVGGAASIQQGEREGTPAWVSIARVGLPFRRASVQVQLSATVAPLALALQRQSAALSHRLAFRDVPHVACARELASRLAEVVAGLPANCVAQSSACMATADAAFTATYDSQVPSCVGSSPALTRENIQALQRVDAAFRSFLSDLPETVLSASFQLENAPPARFSLGVVTGYLAAARVSTARVRVVNGAIEPDPMGRQVTMVVVNGTFRNYDPSRFEPGWRERGRWFVGPVIAPEMGLGAGVSVLLVRGLALNAGAVLVTIRTPADGETIGERPVNVADPFRMGAVRGGFIGLSYNFSR